MMPVLLIELPLPPAELSPNGQGAGSRQASGPARAEYRRACCLIALSARNRISWVMPEKAKLTLVFGTGRIRRSTVTPNNRVVTLPDGYYRPTDPDNAIAAFKAGIDGLRDAFVLTNDTADHLELRRPVIDSSKGPGVWATVEVAG